MAKSYKSTAMAALHESIQGSHDIGLVDATTMRKFNESCLTLVELMTLHEIAEMRSSAGVQTARAGKAEGVGGDCLIYCGSR